MLPFPNAAYSTTSAEGRLLTFPSSFRVTLEAEKNDLRLWVRQPEVRETFLRLLPDKGQRPEETQQVIR